MSVPMSATGRKMNASWTPSSTMTPAAAICPVSLVSASRPNRSSSTPSRQISPPAIEHRVGLRVLERAVQRRQPRGHQDRGGHAGVHRHSPAARRRDRRARRARGARHHPQPHRHHPDHGRGQIGDQPRRSAGRRRTRAWHRGLDASDRRRPSTTSRGASSQVATSRSGRRSADPQHARSAGAVDDRAGRRAGARAAVQHDGGVLAELLGGLLRGGRRRPPGAVGAGHRQRSGAPQQVAGEVVVRQPDGDRALGVAQVPRQRRRVLDDQGQPAGQNACASVVADRRQARPPARRASTPRRSAPAPASPGRGSWRRAARSPPSGVKASAATP